MQRVEEEKTDEKEKKLNYTDTRIYKIADSFSKLFMGLIRCDNDIDRLFKEDSEILNPCIPETFRDDLNKFAEIIREKDQKISPSNYWLTLSRFNVMVFHYLEYETKGASSNKGTIERDLRDVAALLRDKKLRSEMVELLKAGYGANSSPYVLKVWSMVESRIK